MTKRKSPLPLCRIETLATHISMTILEYTESGAYLLDKEEKEWMQRVEKALEESLACAALSARYFSKRE